MIVEKNAESIGLKTKNERESETYTCVNAGCENGYQFEDAPQEWFSDQSLSSPVHCHDCRQWRREQFEQEDVVILCGVCEKPWTVSAGLRVKYHRHDGIWEAFAYSVSLGNTPCHQCQKNPRRVREARQRRAERNYGQIPKTDRVAKDLHEFTSSKGVLGCAESFVIPSDPFFYRRIVLSGYDKDKNGETELTHIMNPKHGFMERLGTDDPFHVIHACAVLAKSGGPSIMQCRSGDDIVKCDLDTGLTIILTARKDHPDGYRLRTAYVGDLTTSSHINYIRKKMDGSGWSRS